MKECARATNGNEVLLSANLMVAATYSNLMVPVEVLLDVVKLAMAVKAMSST